MESKITKEERLLAEIGGNGLPTNAECEKWFEENIGINNDCSASSAIYKFRLWLRDYAAQFKQAEQCAGVWVMSDNNSIPKEIQKKIKAAAEEALKIPFVSYHGRFSEGAEWMYQLRQQEVDELKQTIVNIHRENMELQSQLKAANETIEELRKKLTKLH